MSAYGTADAAILERDYIDKKRRNAVPFESRAQQRFLYANPGKVGGLAKLREWSNATDFSRLPNRAGGKPRPNKTKKRLGPPRRPRGQTTGPGE